MIPPRPGDRPRATGLGSRCLLFLTFCSSLCPPSPVHEDVRVARHSPIYCGADIAAPSHSVHTQLLTSPASIGAKSREDEGWAPDSCCTAKTRAGSSSSRCGGPRRTGRAMGCASLSSRAHRSIGRKKKQEREHVPDSVEQQWESSRQRVGESRPMECGWGCLAQTCRLHLHPDRQKFQSVRRPGR